MKELKVFDQKLYVIAQAIADTIVPSGGAFQPGARDVDAALLFDNYLDQFGKLPLKLVKSALYMLQYVPLLTRLRSFTAMGPQQRLRYLEGWENSRFATKRNLFLMLKMLILMPFYSDDAITQAMKYRPACLRPDDCPYCESMGQEQTK